MDQMTAGSRQQMHGIWSGRWTFILAATGSAVGLGNIWKFPYIAGENGGGAFVLVYLFCIAVIGVPVMMAEVLFGRRARKSPIYAMSDLAREAKASPLWGLIGWGGALAGFLILTFYSVIAGWSLAYIGKMWAGEFVHAAPETVSNIFNTLLADKGSLIQWHSVFMLMTVGVVAAGVTKGLGVAVRVLMPLLFVLLLVLLWYSSKHGDFERGFHFLFNFDFSKLTWNSVLVALGHAFFTLSLGMGAIMAYGAYMPSRAQISKTVITVAFLDTLVALVAGMAIFPIVFAASIEPSAGPGLLFVSLPVAFGNMDSGLMFGCVFFVLVSIAAWSSSISLVEPVVAWMVESGRFNRVGAISLVGVGAWIMGLGTVLSFNDWSDFKPFFGMTFFDFLDFLTANIMLPLGGLLIAVFAGWKMARADAHKEIAETSELQFDIWLLMVRWVSPLAVAAVFIFLLWDKLLSGWWHLLLAAIVS